MTLTLFFLEKLSLPSEITPNPDFACRNYSFFQEYFLYGLRLKIYLKKNSAENGLELKERL